MKRKNWKRIKIVQETNGEEDDDEEDEDYVPPPDVDNDIHNQQQNNEDQKIKSKSLSYSKQRAVDDAFNDLFGPTTPNPADTMLDLDENDDYDLKNKKMKNKKKSKSIAASKKALKKKKQILSDIFGTSSAMKIISKSSSNIRKKMNNNNSQEKCQEQKRNVPLPTMKKKVITEQKVFAGKMIEVQKTVVVEEGMDGIKGEGVDANHGTSQALASSTVAATSSRAQLKPNQPFQPSTSAPKVKGIDAVLEKINGTQKISTIDKTNIDWENFKEKTEGLNDELKQKAEGNEAYLVKKDFLGRVDLRRFEQEKEERNRKRASSTNAK